MTLFLNDANVAVEPLSGWPVPARPRFVDSQAYYILQRELRRYVDEEIPGRSFLISGHRGSGKTALVTRAVEDLRTERLRDSVKEGGTVGVSQVILQRPLFVKLHGPSLMTLVLPGLDRDAAKPKSKPTSATDAGTVAGGGEAAPAAPPPSESHVALVHITIALYRALAAEVATGFGAHARQLHARSRASEDFLELAAQLALELDSGADPALLRGYWSRLARLPSSRSRAGLGVLWPGDADKTLAGREQVDQGLRELVAVATAAQAYRRCAGKESETLSSDASASQETVLGATVANLNDLFNRVGAILVGILAAGATAGEGATRAVGIGLLSGLFSGVALKWTSTRTHKIQQTRKYTFIADRGEATLERDLPTVIRRIRDAGLAPVFVLDELDKVESPRETIGSIIRRLKHLVTDHGFFCFLTDRNYFEEIQRAVEAEVYPTEHTFFSERLLVLYYPENLLKYLLEVIRSDSADDAREQLARVILSLRIIQQAKLNLADMARGLSSQVQAGGRLKLTAADILDWPQYRLAAAMQLAVDEVLRDSELARRLDRDPGFGQLAVDALYMVSRCWEADHRTVDVSAGAIRRTLEDRLSSAAPGRGSKDFGDDRPGPQRPALDAADIDFLKEQVDKLCNLLASWSRLSTGVASRADQPELQLAAVVPQSLSTGLMEWTGADQWRFRFDVGGRELVPPPLVFTDEEAAAQAAPLDIAEAPIDEMAELRGTARAFRDLLRNALLGAEDLIAVGALPATLNPGRLMGTIARGARHQTPAEAAATEYQLKELRGALDRHGDAVANALLLVEHIRLATPGPKIAPALVLKRLARYFDFAPPATEADAQAARYRLDPVQFTPVLERRLDGTREGVIAWRKEYSLWRRGRRTKTPAEPSAADLAGAWDRWRNSVERFLEDPGSQFPDIEEIDLVLLAKDSMPSRLFRPFLARMGTADWSGLALAALILRAELPAWIGLAALRALGFGRQLLFRMREMLAKEQPGQSGSDEKLARAIVEKAADKGPGLLLIAGANEARLNEPPGRFPVLIARLDHMRIASDGLDWLAGADAFAAVIQERTDTSPPPPVSGTIASLPRIIVTRLASGATSLVADAYEVDTLEKVIDTFQVRERAISAREWRSRTEGGPGTAA